MTTTLGSAKTLTKNEIKDIIKVIKYLENSAILLKGTAEKNKGLGGGFLGNVLGPLMKVCLPLMKNVLASLAKSILLSLVISNISISSRCRNS